MSDEIMNGLKVKIVFSIPKEIKGVFSFGPQKPIYPGKYYCVVKFFKTTPILDGTPPLLVYPPLPHHQNESE